jgi:hypothetical protein
LFQKQRFTLFHFPFRPYKKDSANLLQVVCLMCLTSISICSTNSRLLVDVGVVPSHTPMEAGVSSLDRVMLILLPIPPVLLLYDLLSPAIRRVYRCASGTHNE